MAALWPRALVTCHESGCAALAALLPTVRHERCPIPQRRAKIPRRMAALWHLPCPEPPPASPATGHQDPFAFKQCTALSSGRYFIHLVKFPPTQTPTHSGYEKNTVKLGIQPWEICSLNHSFVRTTGVCCLSGTCQRCSFSQKCPRKHLSKPALLLLQKPALKFVFFF